MRGPQHGCGGWGRRCWRDRSRCRLRSRPPTLTSPVRRRCRRSASSRPRRRAARAPARPRGRPARAGPDHPAFLDHLARRGHPAWPERSSSFRRPPPPSCHRRPRVRQSRPPPRPGAGRPTRRSTRRVRCARSACRTANRKRGLMRRMWDAAFPPASPPPWEAVAGYIGGNTPHVWTDQEWARQPARWRLPIFTRSTGGDPNTDAAQAVRWLRAHGVPPGVCVALDYETRIDPDYLRVFDWIIQQAGYLTLLYGTRRTVVQNPRPSGGYWVAEWTGTPHLYPGSAATQWSGSGPFGGIYDPNLVADSTPLWDTQEDDMTSEEHDALMWLRSNAATHGDAAIIIRGDETTDPTKDTHPDNIQRARQDLAAGLSAVASRLDAILNRLDTNP